MTEALKADGVEEIFKLGEDGAEARNIFDDDYLAKIEKIKLPNTKIKLLQQLLAKAIEDFKRVNKARGVDFSKQLQSLVEKYNERKEVDVLRGEVVEDFTDEIIDRYLTMIQSLKQEVGSFADLGIDLEVKAFYDILKDLACKYDFTYPEDQLLPLAEAVKAVVDDKVKYTDWNQRDDIKAELKVDLILLLGKHGYPPVDRDEVYKGNFRASREFQKNTSRPVYNRSRITLYSCSIFARESSARNLATFLPRNGTSHRTFRLTWLVQCSGVPVSFMTP